MPNFQNNKWKPKIFKKQKKLKLFISENIQETPKLIENCGKEVKH